MTAGVPEEALAFAGAPYPAAGDRVPYVGFGVDGCLRSATIDEEEADTFDPGPGRDRCLQSAQRWREQAARWREAGARR